MRRPRSASHAQREGREFFFPRPSTSSHFRSALVRACLRSPEKRKKKLTSVLQVGKKATVLLIGLTYTVRTSFSVKEMAILLETEHTKFNTTGKFYGVCK